MALNLGDIAPDFHAETTDGYIHFHEWIGDSWAALFSHRRDFTPVCWTELGYLSGSEPEFSVRNVKIIGPSVQLTAKHQVATPARWQPGNDVIIAGSVTNDQAEERYPHGWKEPRPYIRIVPDPVRV
jgi:alkyl hydroperoxide reductase subunit AhpC